MQQYLFFCPNPDKLVLIWICLPMLPLTVNIRRQLERPRDGEGGGGGGKFKGKESRPQPCESYIPQPDENVPNVYQDYIQFVLWFVSKTEELLDLIESNPDKEYCWEARAGMIFNQFEMAAVLWQGHSLIKSLNSMNRDRMDQTVLEAEFERSSEMLQAEPDCPPPQRGQLDPLRIELLRDQGDLVYGMWSG